MGIDLVGYWINYSAQSLQIPRPSTLFNYCFASNGVFVHAFRPGLKVCIPVGDCEVRGLTPLQPFVELVHPKIPDYYLEAMLDLSRSACIEKGSPVEALFHLIWEGNRWRLDKPEQEATAGNVRPTEDGEGSSYQRALIELHSHHEMEAFFSGTDDADEQGFRIYAVIGNIFTDPKIRVRVGCYGYFYEVPADTIFELPEGITDAREEANGEDSNT